MTEPAPRGRGKQNSLSLINNLYFRKAQWGWQDGSEDEVTYCPSLVTWIPSLKPTWRCLISLHPHSHNNNFNFFGKKKLDALLFSILTSIHTDIRESRTCVWSAKPWGLLTHTNQKQRQKVCREETNLWKAIEDQAPRQLIRCWSPTHLSALQESHSNKGPF